MAERSGGRLDAGIAVIRVAPEPPVRLAIQVEVLAGEHAALLQDHVLDHAAVSLRHQKSVGRGAVRIAAHQPVIDAVDDFGTGIGRPDMQGLHLLGDVEDALAEAQASLTRSSLVKKVSPGHVVHGNLQPDSDLQGLSGEALHSYPPD